MRKTVSEFKSFLLRGNVVDLAVAVVVGAAFSGIVTALIKDMITPIIAAIGGKPDFSGLFFTINGSEFHYGDFINAVINFVTVAAAVFFLVVKPVQKVIDLRKTDTPSGPVTRECPECLSSIPLAAHRCAFCTAEVPSAAGVSAN
jgi:large conductance mechanosensitive channel